MKRLLGILLVAPVLLISTSTFGSEADFNQWLNYIADFGNEDTQQQTYFTLECAKQDYGTLQINRSCHTLTALCIGQTTYDRGLGSHANGHIKILLNKQAQKFTALVGVDNNSNTKGYLGTVRFFVKDDRGNVLAQTGICKAGDEAVELAADISGLVGFNIIIDDADDGIRYDQADIAMAKIEFNDGETAFLDGSNWLNNKEIPFCFKYDGRSSDELLKTCKHEVNKTNRTDGKRYVHVWKHDSGLRVKWGLDICKNRKTLEANLVFENTGKAQSGIIENVQVLRLDLAGSYKVHYATGGSSGVPSKAFLPSLWDGKGKLTLSAQHGISSGKVLPLWIISKNNEGLFCGLGWTGQWQADFEARQDGIQISAGMEQMNLGLKPGEKITQPSVLIGYYSGDNFAGHNALRNIIYEKYTPNIGNDRPLPPVSWNHWFTFTNNINEQNLIDQVMASKNLGIEYFCVDAGWFMTPFWQVGDWRVNPEKFPNGLEPVAQAIKDNGMKMGLWFEPERVTDKNYEAFEHKEWLIPAVDGQPYSYHGNPINVWILDLSIPDAQQWVIDLIGDYARRLELKWIRFDFNFKLINTWIAASKNMPDRRGLKEIRYVEGLYNILDKLLENHPDMIIEWCAGGGRRIDLETIRRSHTFWKSDLTGRADHTKPHLTGGNLFLPGNYLNSNLNVLESEYDYLGQFAGALGFNHDFRKEGLRQIDLTVEMIKKYKQIRHLLLKDYYPLFDYTTDLTKWDGWQFNDSRAGKGILIVLRPEESPYVKSIIKLRGLDPDKSYQLNSTIGPEFSETLLGKNLSDGMELELQRPRSAMLVEYEITTR